MPVCEFTKQDGTRVRFMTWPDSSRKKSGKNNCDKKRPNRPPPRARGPKIEEI